MFLPDGGRVHFIDQNLVNPETSIAKDFKQSLPEQYSNILKSRTFHEESKTRVRDSVQSLSDLNISIENYHEQLEQLSTLDVAPHVPQHGYVIVRTNMTPYVRPIDESQKHSPTKQNTDTINKRCTWRNSVVQPTSNIDKDRARKLYWVVGRPPPDGNDIDDEEEDEDVETLNKLELELYQMRGLESKFKPMKQVTRVLDFGTPVKKKVLDKDNNR